MSLSTLHHRAMILFDHQRIAQLDSDIILLMMKLERFLP